MQTNDSASVQSIRFGLSVLELLILNVLFFENYNCKKKNTQTNIVSKIFIVHA